MKKILIGMSVAIGIAAVFMFSNSPKKDVLTVGTNAEYPPYTYIQDGQVVGFDLDIATEVCKRLGKKMEVRDVPFDALIAELKLKRVDFVAAGMTKTEERAKRVWFSKPYYFDDHLVIVSFENAPVEDITGKKVVVNEGYTADNYASQLDNIDILRLPNPADAFLALSTGKVDAYITAQSTVNNYLKEHPQVSLHTSLIDQSVEGVSLAAPKDSVELQKQLEKTLDAMKADGTMQALKQKWGLL